MPFRSLALVVLTLLLGTSSCHLFHATIPEEWKETQLKLINQKVLFEGVVFALEREGFRVGTGADSGAGKVESAWRVSASPFKGKGYRERAILHFGPGAEAGTSTVRVRVHRETNESIRPLLEGSAKWERTDDQPLVAARILQYVHSYLDPALPE